MLDFSLLARDTRLTDSIALRLASLHTALGLLTGIAAYSHLTSLLIYLVSGF